MTTPLHHDIDETRSLRTFPLALLAWLEATALKIELAEFIKRARTGDRWYVSRDGAAFGPVPFGKIMRLLLRGEGPLPVLHESEAEMDPAPWRTIAYRTWPLSPLAAKAWIVGFWLLAIGVGFVAVNLVCPLSLRSFAGPAYLAAVVAAGLWLGWHARRTAAPAELEEDVESLGESPAE